ncbi:MAG: acyltransferase family protein [Lachnospiraceae bacterium]|nr:acyltransferase family protein [Lachnospiraceae bacterium]
MSNKRIAWADWVKGILTIVIAHVTQYFSGADMYLNKVLTSYHVPIFFVWGEVSAGLLSQKYNSDRQSFYTKRFKRYIIPYVLFSLFNSALKLGVLLVTHKVTSEALHSELVELFITGNGTVWFLPTLFLAEIIFFEMWGHQLLRYCFHVQYANHCSY